MKNYLFTVNRAVSMTDVVGLTWQDQINHSNKTQSSSAVMRVACGLWRVVYRLQFVSLCSC